MIHKPSPGTRGLVSNQGGISPQGEKFTAFKKKTQKHQVIEISKLSTYILLLPSRKCKNHLSDGEMVYLMIATCPNKINLFCSLLRKLGIEELLKLPIGIANSVYNFRSNLTNSDLI